MEKKSNNKVLIIVLVLVVGSFVVCGCGGILAAIAVPAFVKFQNRSKSAEAIMMTRTLSLAAETAFNESCAFPEPFGPTHDPNQCCGGDLCSATAPAPAWTSSVSDLNSTYYAYSGQPGPGGTFVITATKDFDCGGTVHDVSITVRGTKEGAICSATSDPPVENRPW